MLYCLHNNLLTPYHKLHLRYYGMMLKVPSNTNQPTNQPTNQRFRPNGVTISIGYPKIGSHRACALWLGAWLAHINTSVPYVYYHIKFLSRAGVESLKYGSDGAATDLTRGPSLVSLSCSLFLNISVEILWKLIFICWNYRKTKKGLLLRDKMCVRTDWVVDTTNL